LANVWGVTFFSGLMFLGGFSADNKVDPASSEIYMRLQSIFNKNKYGYNTRFMSDFDLLLEGLLNERFIDESTLYQEDPVVAKEIEDMEMGLSGEFSEADIKNLTKDKSSHAEATLVMRYPGRVGTNYGRSDDLSCYKVHPIEEKTPFM
jgi:hypothetical protein